MPDILIRNFPLEDLELLDAQARRAGLSRTEYLRRALQSEARRSRTPVAAEDLVALGSLVADLDDPDVMRDAWS